jgi:hypothetical protein
MSFGGTNREIRVSSSPRSSETVSLSASAMSLLQLDGGSAGKRGHANLDNASSSFSGFGVSLAVASVVPVSILAVVLVV